MVPGYTLDGSGRGRPSVVLLRGRVVGAEHSSVFLAMSQHGTNGWIQTDGDSYLFFNGRPARAGRGNCDVRGISTWGVTMLILLLAIAGKVCVHRTRND